MKAAFYCRAPYNGTLTIFEQEQLLLDYINQNQSPIELILYAIYVDHQSKEDLTKRPAFSRLIQDAKKDVFQVLFCINEEILGLPSNEAIPTPIYYKNKL